MPNKKRFGKNIKLKRKMKGGALGDIDEPLTPNKDGAAAVQATDVIPVAKATAAPPVATATPVGPDTAIAKEMPLAGGSGSSYNKYGDNIYIGAIAGIGIMGIVWFMLSRSIIRHKYSEAGCYGLIGVSVLLSLCLILFKGIRQIKPGKTIIESIKNILHLAKYLLIRSTPGLLILVQLAVLIFIMYNNADYIYSSENIPQMFNTFNAITIAMVLAQCWVWRKKVMEIMLNVTSPKNPMTLPGFILAAIISGVAISQLYVILEYLRTDC